MNLLNSSIRNLVIVVMLLSALFSSSPSFAADGNEVYDIQDYVNNMQPGWNLGNTFDAVGEDETAWGNPRVTKELIEQIAAQGYKSIRIPVTFDQRMGEGPDYTIDPDFLDRVEQAVEWSLQEDMYVMINIHHDSWVWLEAGMHENHDESLARYDAIWLQLSNHFKDYSNKLMFESINEPRFWGSDSEKEEYLYELNTSFYKIVRESGGNNDIRPLVLPTLDTGSEPEKLDVLYDTIIELDDPHLISTVHFYGFWPFSVNIAGHTRFDEETKNDIIDTFDRVHDKFTANGIPVIIGEYGLLGFDTDINAIQQGEKLKFFEFMTHYAQEKQLTHMLWDNGQHFGRNSYEWSDKELYHMMKASWESRSGTAESDFIYLKKGEQIEDTEIGLNLNGNEFVSLHLNDQDLTEGQDYELNGDKLVVKSSLLSSLTSSGKLGVNTVLTAKFDQGADWRFDIITYDTPILNDAEGTTSDFAIPTLFNGDHLATMEAVYEDGSFAGPQNWTSFKEFAYTFSPAYEQSEIILREAFFNEVEDNKEVNLTFHFWSGEVLSYTIVKDGNNVVSLDDRPEPLDLTELENLILTAEAIKNTDSQYTNKSFSALETAIKDAKSALKTLDSVEALESEIATLQKVIDGLKKEPVDTTKPTEPEKPKGPVDPSKPKEKDKVISKPVIANGKATISSDDIEQLAQKGQFTIRLTGENNIEEILLTADQVSELIRKNANILVEKSGINITIPTTNFNEGDVTIKIEQIQVANVTIPEEMELIGDIFDITISQNGKIINKFTSGDPITLSFPVDKSKVGNVDYLHVFYLDPDTDKWIDIGGEYADGFVTVTTDHLSIFALMEIEEAQIVDGDTSNQNGEKLPKTATSIYTILLIGFMLLVIGTISFIIVKRKRLE